MKNRFLKAVLALTMSIGTNTLVFTSVNAEGYAQVIGKDDGSDNTGFIQGTFDFEDAVNNNAGTPVFVTTDENGDTVELPVADNKTFAVDPNHPATIKFPNAFDYSKVKANTAYDLYMEITPDYDYYNKDGTTYKTTSGVVTTDSSKTYTPSWEASIKNGYVTVNPDRVATHNFTYKMWLVDSNGTKVTSVNFVAGSCYTAVTEGARPWSETGKLYFNGKSTLEFNSVYNSWAPSCDRTTSTLQACTGINDNTSDVYILGHGNDDGVVKGGYVRSEGTGAAEMVFGYIVNTNSFVVDDTTFTADTPENSKLVIPDVSSKIPTGSYISKWNADKDVVVDGTTIKAGSDITPEQLEKVIPSEDTTFKAIVSQYTTEVAQSDSSSTANPYDKFVVKKGDTVVASTTITATNQQYNGSEWNGNPQIDLESLKTYLPSVNYSNITYFVKGDSDTPTTKTTTANSGATTEGGAPVNVGAYYVQATINSGVDGIAAQAIYTTYEITPIPTSSTIVKGKTTDYTGDSIELVTESNTVGGNVWYKVGEDGTWVDTIPTETTAGTYTIYYYVKGDADHSDYGSADNPYSVQTTISKVRAELSTANGTTNVYDGTNKALVADANVNGGTMMYKVGDNGTWSKDIPTDTEVGEYKIYYYVEGDENHYGNPSMNVPGSVISKITPTDSTTTVTGDNRTYDGITKALVTESNTAGGTVYYSLDGKTYSTSIPEVSEAGKYTVYYYVEGDENHNNYGTADEPEAVEVEITPADSTTTITGIGRTYDGTTKALVTESKTTGGTVYYSLDGKTYSTSIPEVSEAGKYTVYYYVEGDENHSDYGTAEEPKTVEVEVKKAASSTEVKSNNFTYDGTSKKVVTAFNTVGGTVYYSLDGKTYSEGIPQLKDVGTYTIYYYVKGDANHSDYVSADKPYSVQVKITEQKTANTSDSSNTLFYGLVGVTSVMVAGVLLVLRRKMVR